MSVAPASIPHSTPAVPASGVLDQAVEETLRRQTVTWQVAETGEALSMSISHVRKLFAQPTRQGHRPTDRECWMFLQLCKARGLNPYVGDAFLVGYDSKDGPSFSLITAHQALLKRAEASGKKTGMESGVIVLDTTTGEERERRGDFFLDDREKLVGGWAKVYRSDWHFPAYERVNLKTFNKGYSRWAIDPAGMIVKVAEASAHRLAFPRETGGLYLREELHPESAPAIIQEQRVQSGAEALEKALTQQYPASPEPEEAQEQPAPAPAEDASQEGPPEEVIFAEFLEAVANAKTLAEVNAIREQAEIVGTLTASHVREVLAACGRRAKELEADGAVAAPAKHAKPTSAAKRRGQQQEAFDSSPQVH